MITSPRLAIVYSMRDIAGSGAARALRELVDAEKATCPPPAEECWILNNGVYLAGYDEETLYFTWLDMSPDPSADAVIILSRHSASSGKPSLTTHHTGNPTSDSSYGGEPYTLSFSAPPLSRTLLRNYREAAETRGLLERYVVTLEATHHGPTSNRKPLVFIEIGSTPEEWRDAKAQESMAEAVVSVLERGIDRDCRRVAGFGETHYPAKFTELHLGGDYCFGHIIPKYAFQKGVTEDVIRQAILKTWPGPAEAAVIRKKSIKSRHRQFVVDVVSSLSDVEVVIL